MKNKITLITLLGFVFLFSPLTQAAESANKVLKETKLLYKKADQLQGAWTTTGKLIKKAESALKKGNKAKALKLAKKANIEVKMSITQAEEQAKNWAEPSYIKR
jgi:hypothetical protein